MSLYKPKNSPYWHYDFVRKGDRFYGSTECTLKSDAKLVENAIRREVALGRFGLANAKKPSLTINEAAGSWWNDVGQFEKNAKTVETQITTLLRIIGKNTETGRIGESTVSAFVAKRRGERNSRYKITKNRPKSEIPLVSGATVNREIELLRRILRWCKRVHKTTLEDIEWGEHKLPEPKARVRELTENEEQRLANAIRPELHDLALFATVSGLRLSNARRLTWTNVNLQAGTVRVRPKSEDKSDALTTVAIGPLAVAVLASVKGQHSIYCFAYICKRSRGHRRKGERYPFSESGWRRDWKDALEVAGISDFRFHDLRHTFASRLLRMTGNLEIVRKALHHSDISTTVKYAHAQDADLRLALAKLPNYSRTDDDQETEVIEKSG